MTDIHSIPGYSGICRCCFSPIRCGEEMRLRLGGLLFHRRCVENNLGSHYVVLEYRRAARRKRKEAITTEVEKQ